jgi:hypothetical protein
MLVDQNDLPTLEKRTQNQIEVSKSKCDQFNLGYACCAISDDQLLLLLLLLLFNAFVWFSIVHHYLYHHQIYFELV